MSDPPTVDGRRREALLSTYRQRSEAFTPEWDAGTDDPGTTLLDIGARFGAALRRRLDRVPEKHRLEMVDELGFGPRPPQAARLPLTVEVAGEIDRNVPIPGGTRVIAQTEGDDQSFEVPPDEGFEATPASLDSLYAVDPATDRIVDHTDSVHAEEAIELFAGSDCQCHHWYLGDGDRLRLDGGATVTLRIETEAPGRAVERWEYHGEDEAGAVGWHELPPIESGPTGGSSAHQSDGRVDRSFRLPGPTVETRVDGTESHWLRCRSGGESVVVETVGVTAGRHGETDGVPPDAVFADDVPIPVDDAGTWQPFGRTPRPPSALNLACAEAFSKPGATVSLAFCSSGEGATDGTDESIEQRGVLEGPPEISWEYWNGSGWSRLELREDGTEQFRSAGCVRFRVPRDIEPTAVAGQHDHWIRARLVAGSYGTASSDTPPRFDSIAITYEGGKPGPVDEIRTRNNGSTDRPVTDGSEPFAAFETLADPVPTVYLGFDAPLRDGPLSMLIDVESASESVERLSFACSNGADGNEWVGVEAVDGTGGLRERGVVEMTFPGSTADVERFGVSRHWLRIRLGDESSDHDASQDPSPVVSGIYPNTRWAYNGGTTEQEVLGSSDGQPDQRFDCSRAPITEIDLWVEESAALSAQDRYSLTAERPEDVETVDGGDSVWVRWDEVSSRREAEAEARQFVVDRVEGTVRFGDGDHGAIPPAGAENVRATYRTGGGTDGNVDAGSVNTFQSSIPLVESVTNHLPAIGGEPVESRADVGSRAAATLRTRGRAVTPADFGTIARQSVSGVAAATCVRRRDRDSPGDVEVIVVPESERRRPEPTAGLERRVREALTERAPATLTTDGDGVVVRGPAYAPVAVRTSVRVDADGSVGAIRSAIDAALTDSLHPLREWTFGAVPTRRDLVGVVDAVDGVSDVTGLSVEVEVDGAGGREPTGESALPEHALVCSGTHSISVTGGDRSGG